MKPKTDLIVNSACLLMVSPFLGMMVAGLALGVLIPSLATIAIALGFLASLFFDVDFGSFAPRWETIKTISIWVIVVAGVIGGLVWALSVVLEKWKKHKIYGTGW